MAVHRIAREVVLRDGHVLHAGAKLAEPLRRVQHLPVHVGLALRAVEALLQDSDPQSGAPPALRHVSDAEPRAFVRRQVGDVGPVLAHGSGVGGQEAHQGLEERGLPHAVVAEDAHNLALADIEVDAVQNRDTAVPAGEPPRLQGDDPFLSHRPPVCPDRRRAPSDPSSPDRHGLPSAPLPGERP